NNLNMVRIRLRLIVSITTSAFIYFVLFPHHNNQVPSSISLLSNWGPATQKSIRARQVLQVPPHSNVNSFEEQRNVVEEPAHKSTSPLYSQTLIGESSLHFSRHVSTVNTSNPQDVVSDSLDASKNTFINKITDISALNDDNNTDFDYEEDTKIDAQEVSNGMVSISKNSNLVELFELDALPVNEFVDGENEEITYDDYDYHQTPEPITEEKKKEILQKSGDVFLLDGELLNKGEKFKTETSSESPAAEVPDERYIPDRLRDRSMLFPSSSEVCTFMAEQKRRVQHVQDICRKYQ
ncbi:unnamed protein product, partial [Meganyctiphanes norvegica]